MTTVEIPCPELVSTPPQQRRWAAPILVGFAIWAVARAVFFVGYEGSDDMFHVRYAVLWDHAPANHWECRLLYNAVLAACLRIGGVNEYAAAIPSLLASAAMQACIFFVCVRHASPRAAWWAGLIGALLPVHVHCATVVGAYPFMVGFLALGTVALLESPGSRRASLLAGLFLGLGLVTHLYAGYYIAMLGLAALAVDWRRYWRPLAVAAGGCVLLSVIDMAVFRVWTGDWLGRIHILTSTHLGTDDEAGYPAIDAAWLAEPIVRVLLSKGFGLGMALAAVAAVWKWKQLDVRIRVLGLSLALFWVLLHYGSQVPWAFRPFWRLDRYFYPQALGLAVVCGASLGQARRWALAAAGVIACGVLLLAGSGSWGQNAHLSRELLAWMTEHPGQRCVTDFHTANEMYILAGVRPVPNLAVSDEAKPSWLIDPGVPRISLEAESWDAALENPLNADREGAAFASRLDRVSDSLRLLDQTRPAYRLLTTILPVLRCREWAIRKPPAYIWAVDRQSESINGGADGR